jgi:4-hydroxybenzoate polyprenyltransferase
MVSGAVFTGGLSTMVDYKEFIDLSINAALLWLAGSSVFLGSLTNEVLLDMSDVNGDKAHGIWTVPVLFGQTISWIFATAILIINTVTTASGLLYLFGKSAAVPLAIVYGPMVCDMIKVQRAQYVKPAIMNAVKGTIVPLVTLLG